SDGSHDEHRSTAGGGRSQIAQSDGGQCAAPVANVRAMPRSSPYLIEFPADDPERARRFWEELLGVELEARKDSEGEGWQTHSEAPAVRSEERRVGKESRRRRAGGHVKEKGKCS